MGEKFTFDDGIKQVLSQKASVKAGRPKKAEAKKNKAINCYLSEEEYEQFIQFLDGRPASVFLRSLVLGVMKG